VTLRIVTNWALPPGGAFMAAARELGWWVRPLDSIRDHADLDGFDPAGAVVFLYGDPTRGAESAEALRSAGVPVLVWNLDDPQYLRTEPATTRAASAASVYCSHTRQLDARYAEHGVTVEYLPTGAWEPHGVETPSAPELDWSFVGTLTPERRAFIIALAKRLPRDVRGRAFQGVSPRDAERIWTSTAVNLAFGACCDLPGERSWGVTDRSWQIPHVSGFLLQEARPHVADHFQLDVEAVTFESVEECAEKLCRYLDDASARRDVAARARRRVLERERTTDRLRSIARLLERSRQEVRHEA
jgi:hypothetical protein